MDNNSLKNASLFDNDPVLYAAWLYYQDGLSQSEVANIMSVSRVTVVKYLHLAREKGFVNISLDSSVFSTIDYSIRIKAKFNLNNVLILPDEEKNKSQQTSNMNRERLAKAGAMYLSQIISNDDILGVAWGRTIHKLGHYLPTKTLENVTVLQMIGAVAPQPDFTTAESAALIANKFSGCSINLHVPTVVSNARLAMDSAPPGMTTSVIPKPRKASSAIARKDGGSVQALSLGTMLVPMILKATLFSMHQR